MLIHDEITQYLKPNIYKLNTVKANQMDMNLHTLIYNLFLPTIKTIIELVRCVTHGNLLMTYLLTYLFHGTESFLRS